MPTKIFYTGTLSVPRYKCEKNTKLKLKSSFCLSKYCLKPFSFPDDKLETDGKGIIKLLKHHSWPDSGTHSNRKLLRPLLWGVPYKSMDAPNGQAQELLRGPSHKCPHSNSSMLLHQELKEKKCFMNLTYLVSYEGTASWIFIYVYIYTHTYH